MDVSIGSITSQGGAFSLFGKVIVANGNGTVHSSNNNGGGGEGGCASCHWTSVEVVGGAVSINGAYLEIHGDGRGYIDNFPVTAGRYMKRASGSLYRQHDTNGSWTKLD